MDARYATWLEAIVDSAAAAILAAAVGFAAIRFGSSAPVAGAVAAATLLGGRRALARIDLGPLTFALRPFELEPLPATEEVDELILEESDRLDRSEADELVLDDVLARLEDFSRVVRLFDRSAMPTPEELKSRIDRHLDGPSPTTAPPDASQALHDALSQLRRTLR